MKRKSISDKKIGKNKDPYSKDITRSETRSRLKNSIKFSRLEDDDDITDDASYQLSDYSHYGGKKI